MLDDNPSQTRFHDLVQQANHPTAFVGRASELADLQQRLADPTCHLLTLLGPGGIGKTRLAREVAARLPAAAFPDGIYFVPLQPLTSPDLIVPAITEAIHLPFYTDVQPKEHLLYYLQNKTMLLLLDNFEHLLGNAELVSEILDAAPGVKLLTTSRVRLNLREEWVFEVGGLSIPINEAEVEIGNYSAVQLFLQHAQRVTTSFHLTGAQTPGVNRICRMVNGMPLALELAATWLRSLTCVEIADEIERGLDILETPDRNVPERHRNMRVVLDHSWQLLSEDEQRVVMQLSVFRGGFTSEAARAVVGATRHMLSALVDKSWLGWNGDIGRYDIHELLRQYSEEKLAAAGEADTIRNAHAEYFGLFMEARERDIKYRRQVEALNEIERDFANVRSAWHWAMTARRHKDIDRMAEALNFFCDMKVRNIEGEEMFRTASECFAGSDDPEVRLTYNRLRARRIRTILNGEQYHLFDLEELLGELETIIVENRQLNDPAEAAFSIYMEGLVSRKAGSGGELPALPYFEESFRIYQQLDDPFYMADTLVFISFYRQPRMPYLQQALDLQRQIGDENGIGWALIALASTAHHAHQFDESERYAEEALTSQRHRGDVKGMWAALMFTGDAARTKGQFEKALALAQECYQAALSMNIMPFKKAAQARLGLIQIITENDWQFGKKLCLACLSLPVQGQFYYYGIPPDIDAVFALAIAAHLENDLSALRSCFQKVIAYMPYSWDQLPVNRLSRTGPAAFLLLDSEGKTEKAVELAARVCNIPQEGNQPVLLWLEKWPLLNRLRAAWEQKLGKEAYAAAWERGTKLDIEATVRLLETDYTQPLHTDSKALPPALPDPLTARELEVLQFIAAGLTNRQIADHFVITPGTAKWYVSQIFSKLAVSNRTQAVARARELNLLP